MFRLGTEYYLGENRGDLRAFSHAVVDAGADLVIGHGPHVLRGMEWYKERLIAYSLGNFAGYGVFSLAGPTAISGILQVTLRADGSGQKGELVPTALVGRGHSRPRSGRAGARDRQELSREDFGERGPSVSAATASSFLPARRPARSSRYVGRFRPSAMSVAGGLAFALIRSGW